ncbi:ABC transporter substrate-binding protein [Natronosporangium hydrolyticum]|uniref:ABC transporter substrate-binding protein n=1 Tax=Natronosporangium hydrolyticum TaxID=2811111 RepID=A0A895Y8M9_9ACTN|nr:ABC transporter substrate-binding protein [Natronosporangium hydrolyticum]QSB12665.1 ABC transporter substrate-binding protein [Natronosporangium hydrolyticum]
MRRSSKRRYGSTVAAAVGAVAMTLSVGCAAVTGGSGPERLLIGVDLELTGDGSELGEIYHNALTLRVEQINELGLLGDRELELDVRDNRSDSATAANNAADLAGDPEVMAIITGGCGPCAVAVAQAADQNEVPTIALAAPSGVIEPAEERRYAFKLGPNADHTSEAIVSELRAEEIDTIAVIAVDDEYGTDGLEEMTSAAERTGIDVVVNQRITGSDESMQSAAETVAAFVPESSAPPEGGFPPPDGLPEQGQPDQGQGDTDEVGAVVMWAYAPMAAEAAGHLRSAGYEGPLYLDAVAADELFLAGQSGVALAGATMVFTETLVIDEVIATSPVRAARKNWFSDYSSRYGTYNAFSSFAADAVQLVVEAVNRGPDEVDRVVLRNIIENLQMEGLTGTIRMSPAQHSGLLPQALATLVARGDRWRLSS